MISVAEIGYVGRSEIKLIRPAGRRGEKIMGWQRAACVHDVKADSGLQVQIGDKTIAMFRLGDKVYALEGLCPHAGAFLAEGFIDGRKLECPLHQAIFDIPSGRSLTPPAERDLTTYLTKIEGDDVLVDVD